MTTQNAMTMTELFARGEVAQEPVTSTVRPSIQSFPVPNRAKPSESMRKAAELFSVGAITPEAYLYLVGFQIAGLTDGFELTDGVDNGLDLLIEMVQINRTIRQLEG